MGSFLGSLASQLSSQMNLGENENHTLDKADIANGKPIKYGQLGELAKKIDFSAERRYLESGYLRRDPYNVSPKQFEVLMQEPNATVLLKKRMFSSLAENYRPDYMDQDEKIYYKAMKILFQNKCNQISALEKLSKLEKIGTIMGQFDDQTVPLIITLTDIFTAGYGQGTNLWQSLGASNPYANTDMNAFVNVVNQLRKIYAYNTPNKYTTWITDNTNMFEPTLGQGTGVIEITNFTSLTTTTTTSIEDPGSFSISISDPYESMLITEYDIEKAIADATNAFYNHKTFEIGKQDAEKLITDLQNKLNNMRAVRKASPISFKINPDTLLGKRVVAIIDRLGEEILFTYDSSSVASLFTGGAFGGGTTVNSGFIVNGKQASEMAGYDGLQSDKFMFGNLGTSGNHAGMDSELSLFGRLVKAIYTKLSLDANSVNAFQIANKNTNYARKKMRTNFLSKLIFQPMDVVNIYVNSKSSYDTKLLSGVNNMFTGLGFLQNLDKSITDIKNATDTLLNPSGSVSFQAEKMAYVGASFPNSLWATIRGQFVTEKEGTSIFAGIVKTAPSKWHDGKFTIDIGGKDNSYYFEQGRVNFNPGVDQYNGLMFDPLTPFKTEVDTISYNRKSKNPEYLEENKILLTGTSGKASLFRQKMGPNAGRPADANSVIQDQKTDSKTGISTKVYYAPDGLAYRWKDGIGVFVQRGSSTDRNNADLTGSPNITKEPFGGQDIMNVISLAITGEPYNFATYWKAVTNKAYYDKLSDQLTKTNKLWGNFIPFKNLTIDEKSYAKAKQTQFDITKNNQELEDKLNKLKDCQNMLTFLGAAETLQGNKVPSPTAQKYEAQAKALSDDIQNTILNTKVGIDSSVYESGSDIVFDYDSFVESDKSSKLDVAAMRKLIRRQINYLTRRMSYNVRANDDKNLFIVDDFYDKDYDIMAFSKKLKDSIALFANSFDNVKDKIVKVAQLLNLEVMCDSQGHIRVRPAQYNRMPSSVFYRMMFLKKSIGVQYFPQFIEDLFTDNLDTIRQQIEVAEDRIRLDGAVLGYNTDEAVKSFLNTSSLHSRGGAFGYFDFISSESNDEITNHTEILKQANPDQDNEMQKLQIQATSNAGIFGGLARASTILDSLTKPKLEQAGFGIHDISQFESNTRIPMLTNRIESKTGTTVKADSYIYQNPLSVNNPIVINKYIDVFKATTELSDKIAERQKLLKTYYSLIKNCIDFKSLDSDDKTSTALLSPGIMGNSHVPEIFEHMIEDETYDDYGFGSGKRYIIRNSQIKSLQLEEHEPTTAAYEVQGILSELDVDTPQELNSIFPNSGNPMVTAVAIDYNLWRNYGFKEVTPIKVPFLHDPETQCGPYASMLLSRERKNIFRGSVMISGNEFMQPGEVIFLEDRGMLFYVKSVVHNFSFGSFTTTLNLTYGHAPGDYIPTPLDMIGKLLYKNKDGGEILIQRQSNSNDDYALGIVVKLDDGSILSDNDSTPTSFNNKKSIENMAYEFAGKMNSNKADNVLITLELRYYYDNDNAPDATIISAATDVKSMLTTIGVPGSNGSFIPTFSDTEVVITPINLSTDQTSPSQLAHSAAKNIEQRNSTVYFTSDSQSKASIIVEKQRAALYQYIVDCYIKIKPVESKATAAGSS